MCSEQRSDFMRFFRDFIANQGVHAQNVGLSIYTVLNSARRKCTKVVPVQDDVERFVVLSQTGRKLKIQVEILINCAFSRQERRSLWAVFICLLVIAIIALRESQVQSCVQPICVLTYAARKHCDCNHVQITIMGLLLSKLWSLFGNEGKNTINRFLLD